MALGRTAKLNLGAAAIAVAGIVGVGFATPPTELPTVTVWHNPT